MNALKERGFPQAWAIVGASLALLAGCNYVPKVNPYRMEIQQGNFVNQEMVSKLQAGMTRDQVKFVLGTPLVVDTFRDDRWDYIFLRTPENNKIPERRRISVFFENDRLKRVDGDVVSGLISGSAAPIPSNPGSPAASASSAPASPTPPAEAPVAQNAPSGAAETKATP